MRHKHLRVPIEKFGKYENEVCFICGRPLLDYTGKDIAYLPTHTGIKTKAKPSKYFLFECPSCHKIGHKRCWYDYGEKKVKAGFFKREWQLFCPSCGVQISPRRDERKDWKEGYQIYGYDDDKLIEIHVSDIKSWKSGSFFRRIGEVITNFFKAVGLGSLTDNETNAIARAAQKVGKTIHDVAEKVFKLDIDPEKRSEMKELKCQNCGAPLPLPEPYEEAVVCAHCGTAHLLPT
jgi:hypothetical protein